ncbi:MAG TPA: anti-sigma factor [Candidatus Limnocylindrales bacterium]|nr:anti-sigma factor [Candidatus Limnocylindrales bacterium]
MTTDRPMSCDDLRDLAAGFVLGALETAEERAVRDHLASCPEPHPEFAELGGVVPYLAESAAFEAVEPPAALRGRILAAAAAEGQADEARPAPPTVLPTAAERAERAIRRPRARPLDWMLRVAAVVAIVALAGWNLLLQGQLNGARSYDGAVAAVIEAAGEAGSRTVILTPGQGQADDGARGIAAVRADGSVVLAVRNLAATSGAQVYETWVIAGETAPVPIGSFTVGTDGTGTFTTRPTDAPPGVVIALTLEPNAGNTAPTGPIVASGVAGPPTS